MGKRFGCTFMIAVFIMFTVAACNTGDTSVPDVFGRTLEHARLDLEAEGLRLGDVRYDPSAPGSTGRIIDQSPAADLRVRSGKRISVTLSGPELVRVPRLDGESLSAARSALRAIGLDRGPVTEISDDRVEKGVVLRQDPAAGRWVPKDTPVRMTVSDGPEMASVPGVTGLQEQQARSFLYDVGLRPYVSEEYNRNQSGFVLEQYPRVRTEVVLGETVEIVVSAGPPPVVVPDVRGMKAGTAENALKDAGLQFTYAPSADDGKSGQRYIYSQVPYGGAVLPEGSGVVLRVRIVE